MTKQEILKTHKMTEQEFYKKFPTQEAYNQFQMGGSLSPKQKFQTGGFTPLLPAADVPASLTAPVPHFTPGTSAPAAAAKGGFKLPDMSGLGGGQQAPQQAGSDPNAPVKKSTGKTIGGIAGGIAGVALAPFTAGISTVVGPALGSAIGGGIDNAQYKNKTEDYNAIKSSQQNAMTSNIAGNFNPNAQGKTFKMGGNFTEYHGNTHENGGIPIGQSEVEGGETNNNGYIYSDTLKLGKKTFADMSKKINNKYSRRPDDKISMESKERELGNLAKMQESTGLTNNSRGMFFTGGFGIGDDTAGGLVTSNTTQYLPDEEFFTDPEAPVSKNNYSVSTGSGKGKTPPPPPPPPPSTPGTPPDTNKPLQTKVNPLGYLASAIGPAYDVARGLKGGDPVNFDRMNTKYQYADPRGAMAAANKGLTSAYNSAKNAARNTTTSAGEYLANMGNLTSKEGMERAATMAGIKNQYDAANTQGLNQTNLTKDQYNAQIQMRESEARQQEQDAARSAVSQGLHNFGQNSLGYGQDRAMNKTQNTMLPLLADGYEYVMDADGKVSSRKKISTNDKESPLTPAPGKP